MDFDTAFLNSKIGGATIYIEQSEMIDVEIGRVCLLLKGRYGLKQEARPWYQTLHRHSTRIKVKRSYYDVGYTASGSTRDW